MGEGGAKPAERFLARFDQGVGGYGGRGRHVLKQLGRADRFDDDLTLDDGIRRGTGFRPKITRAR